MSKVKAEKTRSERVDFFVSKNLQLFTSDLSMGVCGSHPECCNGDITLGDFINYTFAAIPGNDYCYPPGICGRYPDCCLRPGDKNEILANATAPYCFDQVLNNTAIVEPFIDSIIKEKTDWNIWHPFHQRYYQVPTTISDVLASIGIVCIVLTISMFIYIVLKYPLL